MESVHFVASDAHNVDQRPLRLREAYEVVAKRKGTAIADALFERNPRAVFDGLPLPYQPEQTNAKARSLGAGRRKRFLFF
jgi:protein-tyrosine phosphatase